MPPGGSMLRSWIALTIALVTLSGSALDGQRPAYRSGVDLVVLNVTVTDTAKRYVVDLERDDFVVLEDGRQQAPTFFSKPRVPLALALLLDTSASMQQALPTAQAAAAGFVQELGRTDVGTAIGFDSRLKILHGPSQSRIALEAAIRSTTADGATSLYDAVYITLKELNKMRPKNRTLAERRPVMVVLSDGEDTSSLVSLDDVLDLATRSDTIIYSIGLGRPQLAGVWSPRDAPYVLRRLSQQTGGRVFFPQDPRDLEGVYSDIKEELASQYLVAYEPAIRQNDGQWRNISIQLSRGGLMARTKRGYYDGTENQ
ncbi:MAG: VWA domain-containing protein [Luteitalea sp.]|nr:VWA domain-containing protein [Luteitalea sp.]